MPNTMYSKINNLLSGEMQREMEEMRRELEESRKQLTASAEEMRRDADKLRQDLRNRVAANQRQGTYTDKSLYDSFYSPLSPLTSSQFETRSSRNQPSSRSKNMKKQLRVVDKTTINDDITTYTTETHTVRISTAVTSQEKEYGTRKIIGMETVDWWEYVLVYGFLKGTKIAYEYNIVKDLVNKPEHIVSLVDKGVVILTFTPKKFVPKEEIQNDPNTNENVIIRTGTLCREVQLKIEIPYKKNETLEEVKKGFFLYEEKFEKLVPDYEALGVNIAKELNDKKMSNDFKLQIVNEIENGRIPRI